MWLGIRGREQPAIVAMLVATSVSLLRQRHTRRRLGLRRSRVPCAHGLGGDVLPRAGAAQRAH